jgi:hypothetical protein
VCRCEPKGVNADMTSRRLLRRLCEIRKPLPRRPAFDLPIAQLDMFDDRVGDYVALGVGQRSPALANLEREREAHVTAQFLSDRRTPFGHEALENGRGTEVNRLLR